MMNEENAYNLIEENWIPVLMKDGTNKLVPLDEIFTDVDGDIADLALNPYERVAVFRLLLCIAQAALGPERLKDEHAWLAAKDAVGPASSEYLKKWHGRFFLYGPHAFLQPDDVTAANADALTSCDKLAFRLASGNNSTLFDHAAVSDAGRLSSAELALSLLTYQNFSAGGLSGKCIWSGIETEKSIKGAPCRESSMLFSILIGDTLLETIWLNLLTSRMVIDGLAAEWGVPTWELPALSRKETAGIERTLLGHLSPLARAIKLTRGESACVMGGGVTYPAFPEWREPMASVKINQAKNNPLYVSTDPARMPWRDLGSILEIRETGGRKSALALRHLESLQDEKEFTLWTGGLYSEKAKEIDTVEWKVRLSVSLLEEPAMYQYENAIGWADRQRQNLYFATAEYATVMLVDEKSRFARPAERIYWDILGQPENQKLVQDVYSSTYLDDWKKATRKAAEEAYRRACPAMNARQMEAYAQGFAKLRVRDESEKEDGKLQTEERT